jgi:hypothetical protein
MASDYTVLIHGSEWKLADVQGLIANCRKRQWRRQHWVCRDALVQRAGTTLLYIGQEYDPADFELVHGGWKRDHCEICWWELFESNDEEHAFGYTDGRKWICSECYHLFIKPGGDVHRS